MRPAGGSAVVDTDGSNGQGITNAGTINVASGKLTVRGANYPMILDNEGTASRSAATSWRRPLGTGKAAELTVTRAKGRTR